MLESYLMEIIAGVSVAVVIVAYIVIKKVKKTQTVESDMFDTTNVEFDSYEDELSKSEETTKDISEEKSIEKKEEAHQEIDSQLLNGNEEGSFGDEAEFEAPKETKTDTTPKRRKKKDIAPHGKITKDNFKEFAGMRVLVAEDNMINQKVINGLLADSGIDIVIADDGQEALDILEKDSDFTLVLMDAHMPRVDGFEATRKIRETPKYDHILVVALSGDTAADDIKKMRDAGMEEQLEKPLKVDALYDIFAAYHNTGEEDETESDDNEYVSVLMTKELDGDKGLEICGGDKSFYLEILNEFTTDYSQSATKLENLLKDNDIRHADRVLLDIVGITANIGASNLNAIAQDLKDAIHDTEEKSYITLLDEYKKHLVQLLRDIKEFK